MTKMFDPVEFETAGAMRSEDVALVSGVRLGRAWREKTGGVQTFYSNPPRAASRRAEARELEPIIKTNQT